MLINSFELLIFNLDKRKGKSTYPFPFGSPKDFALSVLTLPLSFSYTDFLSFLFLPFLIYIFFSISLIPFI